MFDKKLWLCHSQAIDLFTDTAAILNLLVLRSIMGCPGGTRSVFTLAENFTVYFSGERQSLLHLNTARRSFFPITIGTLRSNDADGKENVKKQYVLEAKQLCTCMTLFCTFLCPFLHDYDVKMPNDAFYGRYKQATTKFYFSF